MLSPATICRLLLCLTVLSGAGRPAGAASWPVARGTFVQEWLVRGWNTAQWDAEFAAMKQVGMDTLVLQWVCDSKAGQTIYPTRIPGLRQAPGCDDALGRCLRRAESAGIKVFVGLNISDEWWTIGTTSASWLHEQMDLGNRIAKEVYDLYHTQAPNALHGWYWAWEVDNVSSTSPTRRQNLATALTESVGYLHGQYPTMPLMLSPFFNDSLGTPDACRSFWTWIFANCPLTAGDIFCPQDGVGAGNVPLTRLPAWFAALKLAVDSKPGLRLWSDTETFHVDDWTAATLGEMVAQLKAVQPWVECSVTFAWSHYQSPNIVDPAVQCALMGYVAGGSLETSPPTRPTMLTAARRPDGKVALSWQPSRDDYRVFGYEIFRNGMRITRQQSPRGNPPPTKVPTSYTDASAPAAGPVTYSVRAYDAAGNRSAAAQVSVE